MKTRVGTRNARALSESPNRLSTARRSSTASPIGTAAEVRPGKADVNAATPAVIETATVKT
jgi:hypothetical protein